LNEVVLIVQRRTIRVGFTQKTFDVIGLSYNPFDAFHAA